jgi:hypothetical protein
LHAFVFGSGANCCVVDSWYREISAQPGKIALSLTEFDVILQVCMFVATPGEKCLRGWLNFLLLLYLPQQPDSAPSAWPNLGKRVPSMGNLPFQQMQDHVA